LSMYKVRQWAEAYRKRLDHTFLQCRRFRMPEQQCYDVKGDRGFLVFSDAHSYLTNPTQ
jgi:hypothetical protein